MRGGGHKNMRHTAERQLANSWRTEAGITIESLGRRLPALRAFEIRLKNFPAKQSEVDSANASGTQALTLRGLSNPGDPETKLSRNGGVQQYAARDSKELADATLNSIKFFGISLGDGVTELGPCLKSTSINTYDALAVAESSGFHVIPQLLRESPDASLQLRAHATHISAPGRSTCSRDRVHNLRGTGVMLSTGITYVDAR